MFKKSKMFYFYFVCGEGESNRPDDKSITYIYITYKILLNTLNLLVLIKY